MSKALCFWVVFLISLILACYAHRDAAKGIGVVALGETLLVYLLLALLGWAVFSAPVH